MSIHVQIAARTSRADALKKLGLRSRTTLTNYCNNLGIPHGLHSFTVDEFEKLSALREWRLRGGRISDFCLNSKGQSETA